MTGIAPSTPIAVAAICGVFLMEHAGEARREARTHPTLERDGFICSVPTCTVRDPLHAHHLHSRSAGGDNSPGNLAAMCLKHHLFGIHAGRIIAKGEAPWRIRTVLGVRSDGPPNMVVEGRRIVFGRPDRRYDRGGDETMAVTVTIGADL